MATEHRLNSSHRYETEKPGLTLKFADEPSNPAWLQSEVSDQKSNPKPFALLKRMNDSACDSIVPALLTYLFTVFGFMCVWFYVLLSNSFIVK